MWLCVYICRGRGTAPPTRSTSPLVAPSPPRLGPCVRIPDRMPGACVQTSEFLTELPTHTLGVTEKKHEVWMRCGYLLVAQAKARVWPGLSYLCHILIS